MKTKGFTIFLLVAIGFLTYVNMRQSVIIREQRFRINDLFNDMVAAGHQLKACADELESKK
jgi:hypothetical protein